MRANAKDIHAIVKAIRPVIEHNGLEIIDSFIRTMGYNKVAWEILHRGDDKLDREGKERVTKYLYNKGFNDNTIFTALKKALRLLGINEDGVEPIQIP